MPVCLAGHFIVQTGKGKTVRAGTSSWAGATLRDQVRYRSRHMPNTSRAHRRYWWSRRPDRCSRTNRDTPSGRRKPSRMILSSPRYSSMSGLSSRRTPPRGGRAGEPLPEIGDARRKSRARSLVHLQPPAECRPFDLRRQCRPSSPPVGRPPLAFLREDVLPSAGKEDVWRQKRESVPWQER